MTDVLTKRVKNINKIIATLEQAGGGGGGEGTNMYVRSKGSQMYLIMYLYRPETHSLQRLRQDD